MNWNTFFKRLGSAIVFCLIMLGGLLWNSAAFFVLTTIIMLLCFKEYFKLSRKALAFRGNYVLPEWFLMLGSIVLLAFFFFTPFSSITLRIFWPALVILISTSMGLAFLWPRGSIKHAAILGSAVVYILVPMACFLSLREISPLLPVVLILMIWMNDTMAYLVGSFFGRTPFNSISPKKTWEGTLGGIFLTLVSTAIWAHYTPLYSLTHWIAIAFCVCIGGTTGDLIESKIKRDAGVKDSGQIMPGHGGALDRFDSLLFSVPFVFAYCWLFLEHLPWQILP